MNSNAESYVTKYMLVALALGLSFYLLRLRHGFYTD